MSYLISVNIAISKYGTVIQESNSLSSLKLIKQRENGM